MTLEVVVLLVALGQKSSATGSVEQTFHRAAAELQAGDFSSAARDFQTVVRAQPNNVGALANLGVTYARMERHADAIAAYRKALKLAPNEPMLLLNLGLAHLKQGDYTAAKPLFEKVDRSPQATAQSRQLLATCELFTGAPGKALSLVSQLPNSPERSFIEGTAYLRLKQRERAKEIFSELLNSRLPAAQSHFLLGRAYLDSAMFEEAIAEFQQADAASTAVQVEIAKAQIGLRRNEEAVRTLMAILEREPENADANYYLGALLVLENREAEAIAYLERARNARPEGWGAYYYLGRANMHRKQATQALPLLERASQLNPSEAAVWFQLARAYQALSRPADARAARAQYDKLRESSLEAAQQVLAPAH